MKTTIKSLLISLAVVAVVIPAVAQAKPKIVLLATGGTIAGVQPSPNDAGSNRVRFRLIHSSRRCRN